MAHNAMATMISFVTFNDVTQILWQLANPIRSEIDAHEDLGAIKYVLTSCVMYDGERETLAFPADGMGGRVHGYELSGSMRGSSDHATVIARVIERNPRA